MGNSITGKEYPLSKIFSNEFEFHIPAYQRPYAWTETQTGELFKDLYDFFISETNENYFLGSIVLIKKENDPVSNVIDGQQRLTTLTILLAVIADYYRDPGLKSTLKEYIQSKENVIEGIEAKPRLFLRERDQDFFHNYIQEIRLDELIDIDPATLETEAQKHIQNNCKLLREELQEKFENVDQNQLKNFSMFLVKRCYMVAVSTPSQNSAFRVFSVMNSRGLDLLPIDIIKSNIIGKISENERDKYTDIWESLENDAGRDGFNEVFTHTRTIFAKERPKKNLLEEFNESVMPKFKNDPKRLIDDYLTPYTEAYIDLKSCQYESSYDAEDINQALTWLNKTNNHDWMPPAIKFFSDHKGDSAYLCWFVKKLERLASYLLVTAKDVNQRFDRYNWLLVEMDERPGNSLENPLKNIELTDFEKGNFVKALNGDIYTMPSQRRNYIIQRLDSFVSDGGATYNTKLFTIEHVLPQNPDPNGEWAKLWPDENERKIWLNRIANLVPLTRKKNSAAQNYDFATKKEKYFQDKNGTSSFKLTTQVLNEKAWTLQVVKNRQRYLINIFKNKDNWDLNLDPASDISRDSNGFVFLLAGRGGNASGYPIDNDKFVVKEGSHIASDITESAGYINLRDRLMDEKVIVDDTFVRDYTFDSPTAAATIILGRSSNGRREWACLDGRTLAMVGR